MEKRLSGSLILNLSKEKKNRKQDHVSLCVYMGVNYVNTTVFDTVEMMVLLVSNVLKDFWVTTYFDTFPVNGP